MINKLIKLINTRSRILVILFYIIFLCIGLAIFKDYGISWDEPATRTNGIKVLNYVLKSNAELLTFRDKYYGPAFDTFLVVIERLFKLTNNLRTFHLEYQ